VSAVVEIAAPEWRTVKLGDILKLHYGKALPDSDRNPDGKIPVYGANGIKDHADKSLCDGPTLVIGRKGSAGEITRVEGAFWPLDVTYYTSHDRGQLDFDYMAYVLSMLNLPSLARGVKPGINRNDIYAIEVRLPPLDEQKRIVAVLDQAFAALDRARVHAEANLADAQQLIAGVTEQMFPDDCAETSSRSLADLCEAIVDCEHKTAPTQDQGIPSIRTPNIGKGVLLLSGVNRVSEETYREWTRRTEPQPGDLILAREAPAGNVAVIPEGMRVCLGQRTVLLRPKKDLFIPAYLAHLLLRPSSQARLLAHSRGATVQHVNVKDIRAFKVSSLPSLAEQEAVVRGIEQLMAQEQALVGAYTQKLADLATLRQSLLQKAFSGQLT